MNVHSYGGYFMWPPGAYKAAGRVTLPAPNIGVEKYFWAASDRVLNRVKEERDTAILPGRTGAVVDVLYSAAGNTADDEYYTYGILGWDFEVGADIFNPTTGVWNGVGFQPVFAPEGNAEALEFSSGNYGLLEVALAYALDTTPPVANIVPNGAISQTPVRATFEYGDEPSVIYYTLDGSTPTTSSPTWEAQGPRLPGQVFQFDANTTIKWIAKDIKGNVSAVRSAEFVVDAVPLSDLAARRSDDDARLTWTHLGSSVTNYEVWRSSLHPYFVPGAGVPGANDPEKRGDAPPPSSGQASYLDAGALSTGGTSYFYVVVPISASGLPYPPSNRVGVVNFTLAPGSP